MSNVQFTGAGNPIPSTTLVATDQVTIFGDGSGQNPLTTSGGSSGNAFQPIAFTAQMLLAGEPLATAGGGSSAIVRSIAGINNGSAAQPIGVAVPTLDGLSLRIQTSGVADLPTTDWDVATGGSGGLTVGSVYYCGIGGADGYLTPDVPIGARVGWAISATELVIDLGSPPNTIAANPGITTACEAVVQSSSALAGAIASSLAGCVNAIGLVLFQGSTKNIVVPDGGIVTAATAVWDTVTGQSGGLTEGAIYYVSAAAAGHIVVSNAPSGTGDFAMGVGVALSSTEMLVNIGTPIGPHA